MGSEETQYYIYHDMYSRSEIVALSVQPPGVNKLCVCVYLVPGKKVSRSVHLELQSWDGQCGLLVDDARIVAIIYE